MILTDSHCHLDRLDLTAYNGDLNLALKAAQEQSVNYFLCVCIDLENFPKVLEIAEAYPNVYASVGVHPTEDVPYEPTVEDLVKLASHPKVVALGETGLDYYRDDSKKALQQQRFRNHIRAAKQVNKPIIVHTRQARADTIAILKEEGAETARGVMHCFTEDFTMAQQAIALNFYISFSGIVTFKNAKELQQVAQQVPLEKILIETDAPYLAPIPYRGKPNEPAYVRFVAQAIADLKRTTPDIVAQTTTKNFLELFHGVTP